MFGWFSKSETKAGTFPGKEISEKDHDILSGLAKGWDREAAKERAQRMRDALHDPRHSFLMRKATVREYAEFLLGYLRNGGRITHFYTYNMPSDEFFVALHSCKPYPAYGADSFQCIVPVGLKVTVQGHCNSYHMDGFVVNGDTGAWVPMYPDVQKQLELLMRK